MSGMNRRCLVSGLAAVGLAIVLALVFVDARLAGHPDANIGGGLLALSLMCVVGFFGVSGLREARSRDERGAAIAIASLAFLAPWVIFVLIAAVFY